jgi:hypothetical protein
MSDLATVAPAFIETAHRIVWAVAATVDRAGSPRTRILHPLWEWDGTALTGWIATSPRSLKAAHLARTARLSLTYWTSSQDTCTADCATAWETSDDERRAGWDRFANAPAPVGYVPSVVPDWDHPLAPDFGILRLTPDRLRVMPGSVMLAGKGTALTWRRRA